MKLRSRVVSAALLLLLVSVSAWSQEGFLSSPEDSFRLMSYNPYWDAIFQTGIRAYDKAFEFQRVLRAVKPDIACIQEIDPRRNREAVVAIFGQDWTVVSGADNVIASRFPITWARGEVVHGRGSRSRGHVLALVDLPGELFKIDVLVVGAHFVSGGSRDQIQDRTVHGDAIVADVRRAIAEGHVPPGTPVILAGDFNAYGTDPRRHLDSLIRGDIADEKTYGPDGSLDPAAVPMIDLLPVHNGSGSATWTWRDDTQRFEPYALDRIIYSGSRISAARSLVLNTSSLSQSDLAYYGLEDADVALDLASGEFDHLPLVADFRID